MSLKVETSDVPTRTESQGAVASIRQLRSLDAGALAERTVGLNRGFVGPLEMPADVESLTKFWFLAMLPIRSVGRTLDERTGRVAIWPKGVLLDSLGKGSLNLVCGLFNVVRVSDSSGLRIRAWIYTLGTS